MRKKLKYIKRERETLKERNEIITIINNTQIK